MNVNMNSSVETHNDQKRANLSHQATSVRGGPLSQPSVPNGLILIIILFRGSGESPGLNHAPVTAVTSEQSSSSASSSSSSMYTLNA